ncbi:MAG: ABC transporter ATP-binding protein [Alphaproteobacteria bacterium]|nr:ABC transporter ATP-binding protein [Alphaproteobacteria bacterium]
MNDKQQKIPQTFWPFLHWCYKDYPVRVVLFFIALIGASSYSTVSSFTLKKIIDSLNISPALAFDSAFASVIVYILVHQGNQLLWRCIGIIRIHTAPMIKTKIMSHLFNYIGQHSHAFFQNNLKGSLSAKINIVALFAESTCYGAMACVLHAVAQIFISSVAIAFIHPLFATFFALWVCVFFVIIALFQRRIMRNGALYAQELANVSGRIVDSTANIDTVRLFSRLDFETQYIRSFTSQLFLAYQRKEWTIFVMNILQGICMSSLLACGAFGLLLMYEHSKLSLGDAVFILGSSAYIADNLWNLVHRVHDLQDATGQVNSALSDLLAPIGTKDSPEAEPLKKTRGAITFHNVTFSYNKEEEPLFENLSLTIPHGQKVGIVGESGSGKSSFLNLFLRLYDVDSGSITLDGQDIRNIQISSLHQAVGCIPQHAQLFHRSLKENILYGKPNASMEEVTRAAQLADADSFIKTKPEGYDSIVGEQGLKLSGGQKQRVTIARVILKNAPILVLDEAASQLDPLTEQKIQETITDLMDGKTALIATHRVASLRAMDTILVFSEGKIIEQGQFDELLAQQGTFYSLYKAQTEAMRLT